MWSAIYLLTLIILFIVLKISVKNYLEKKKIEKQIKIEWEMNEKLEERKMRKEFKTMKKIIAEEEEPKQN